VVFFNGHTKENRQGVASFLISYLLLVASVRLVAYLILWLSIGPHHSRTGRYDLTKGQGFYSRLKPGTETGVISETTSVTNRPTPKGLRFGVTLFVQIPWRDAMKHLRLCMGVSDV